MLFYIEQRRNVQGNLIRTCDLITLKLLKELKAACVEYCPMAPCTQTLLKNMSLEALPPRYLKEMTKACLSGEDYLLWKTEFTEQCQASIERNRAQQISIYCEILVTEGSGIVKNEQLDFDITIYAQINADARKTWNKLPSYEEWTEKLSNIRQEPANMYQEPANLSPGYCRHHSGL